GRIGRGFDRVECELGHVGRVERGTPAASLIWLAPFFSGSRAAASTAGTPSATVKNPSGSMCDARRRTAGAARHGAGINRVRPRRQRSFRCPANRTPPIGKETTMSSPSDAEVIGRSLGEPEAFGLIYDRHAATLLRFLGRRVGAEVSEGL